MSSKNRARTRAVRAEMARTGDSYTRAAARGGSTPPAPTARTGIDGTGERDAVREHVRRLLQAMRADDQLRLRRIEELEQAGHRIVDGGQIGRDTWEIYDWRTGELLVEGDGGIKDFDAAAARLDPDNTWFHRDHIGDDVPLSDVETPGVPASLGRALENWLSEMATPDEEVAAFVGWSVDDVTACRVDDA